MAIDTTTVKTNLTSKLNATSGTTDAKEFLLLGKAVEALTPSVAVQDVIDQGDTEIARITSEGSTQVAAVQSAATGYAPLSGAVFTSDVDFGTNKITYSNVYSQVSDLPAAASYHGMFAHVHATGAGYFSHAGVWWKLVNEDASGNVVISGNLTVNGTTTTINSTTLDVDDLNITVASGAADAAAANGAGLTVDGAAANITYTSSTDTWDFNKAITGTYTNLHPVVNSNAAATGATTFDVNKPMHHFTMTGAATFSGVGIAAGKTSMMVLDTSATPHTPSWNSDIKWPNATEPTWADYRYWIVSFTCLNGTTILASASGYTV